MRDIGKNIRELRCAKGLTQEELGERLHVTRQTVSNYENGRTRPDIDMLLDMAAALDTDANALLYGTPQMEDRRREYRRLALSFGLFLFLFVCYKLLRPEILEIQAAYFEMLPALLLNCTLKPMYMLALGWTAVQSLAMFLKAKPLNRPWVKYARPGAAGAHRSRRSVSAAGVYTDGHREHLIHIRHWPGGVYGTRGLCQYCGIYGH